MTLELSQSKLIYGIHERCPVDVMPDGWVLYIAEVGNSTVPHPGIDLSEEPRAVMIRIQWLFGADGGCYPPPHLRAGFIQRIESLVRNTPDCHIFIGGNEPNIQVEGLFTPQEAAENYNSIYSTIHGVAGHESDLVLLPPVGPWNVESGMGWIEYFLSIVSLCHNIDGFALHTYSRGSDPSSVSAQDKMDPPYQMCYNGFRTYRDWIGAIPEHYQDRPVHITETDQNDAWLDVPNTWVRAAYAEINDWNQDANHQIIQSLILYRWPSFDKYNIEGKQHVISDFLAAQQRGYTWKENDVPDEWTVLVQTSMNEGFYAYMGEGELTLPKGLAPYLEDAVPLYEHDGTGSALHRPEYAARADPHVNTPPHAAGMFSMSSTVESCIVFPVKVTPGTGVRANVFTMARDAAGAGYGTRLGIAVENPGAGSIEVQAVDSAFASVLESCAQWGEWNETDTDGEWTNLWSTVVRSVGSKVWIMLHLRKNYADPAHSHWDDLTIEIRGGSPPPAGDLGDQLRNDAAELDLIANDIRRIATQVDLLEAGGYDPAAVALVDRAKSDLESALTLMGGPG